MNLGGCRAAEAIPECRRVPGVGEPREGVRHQRDVELPERDAEPREGDAEHRGGYAGRGGKGDVGH